MTCFLFYSFTCNEKVNCISLTTAFQGQRAIIGLSFVFQILVQISLMLCYSVLQLGGGDNTSCEGVLYISVGFSSHIPPTPNKHTVVFSFYYKESRCLPSRHCYCCTGTPFSQECSASGESSFSQDCTLCCQMTAWYVFVWGPH